MKKFILLSILSSQVLASGGGQISWVQTWDAWDGDDYSMGISGDFSGSSQIFEVYLDTDSDPSTGYGSQGTDYMISYFEGEEHIYKYIGVNNSTAEYWENNLFNAYWETKNPAYYYSSFSVNESDIYIEFKSNYFPVANGYNYSVTTFTNNWAMIETESGSYEGTSELVNFTEEQRLIADEFISIFENSTKTIRYDYAKNIHDNRGITAGRAGFTSATGDMRELILDYTQINPDNLLIQYVDELKRLSDIRYTPPRSDQKDEDSAETANLPNLIENWKETALRLDFRDAQDIYVDIHYFNIALEKSHSIGATLPLTLLSLYDTNIQHGEGGPRGLTALVNKATEMTGNQTPADGANEVEWLTNFNINRRNVMNSDETWKDAVARIDELEDLIAAGNFQLEPFTVCIQRYQCVLGQGSEDEYNLP